MTKHSPQPTLKQEGWLYSNATGYRRFYGLDEATKPVFLADQETARLYPTGHKMTPVYSLVSDNHPAAINCSYPKGDHAED